MDALNRKGSNFVTSIKHHSILLISTAAVMALGCTSAFAQQSEPESNAGARVRPLEEIVVTAQRKVESLQDVAISVSVLGGTTVTNMNIVSLQEVGVNEPGVTISPAGRGDRVSIRGVASGTNASLDQSVPTFVDDVFHGRGRMTSQNLMDIERIEILKGPQTTYFGNNAIGGAINVTTKQPENTRGGLVRGLYGSDGEYALEAALNLPLSDTLAVRGAVLSNGMDGYINDPTGGDVPNAENYSGRFTALWSPTEKFELTVKAEVGDNTQGGAVATQIGKCPPQAPFSLRGFCADALAAGDDGQINLERRTSPDQVLSLETEEFVVNASYIAETGIFTSITAYSHYNYDLKLDSDQGPMDGLNATFPEQQDQFSQEFRWTSDLDGSFQYTVGAYYQDADLDVGNDFVFHFLSPTIMRVPPFAGLIPYLPFSQRVASNQKVKDRSVFASATWDVTSDFAVTVAGRYTEAEKDFTQVNFFGTAEDAYGGIVALPAEVQPLAQWFAGAGGLGQAGTINLARKDSDFNPSISARYQFTPNVSLYASYSEGFKAGGFNGANSSGDAAALPFEPEEVAAYEAGVKSYSFDGRLLANFAVFYSDYSDLQVTFAELSGSSIVSSIRNAATAITKGLEGELKFAATDRLTLGAKFTLLDFEYKSYKNAGATALQKLEGIASQDLSGRPRPYAPDASGNLSISYVHPLNDMDMDLAFDALGNLSSSYYLTDPLDENVVQPGYATLDLRVSLTHRQSDWQVALIAKNVTNEEVWVFAQDQPRSGGSYFIMRNRPSSVAIQIAKRW
jgi:iron complex outermembrane receptor protein